MKSFNKSNDINKVINIMLSFFLKRELIFPSHCYQKLTYLEEDTVIS